MACRRGWPRGGTREARLGEWSNVQIQPAAPPGGQVQHAGQECQRVGQERARWWSSTQGSSTFTRERSLPLLAPALPRSAPGAGDDHAARALASQQQNRPWRPGQGGTHIAAAQLLGTAQCRNQRMRATLGARRRPILLERSQRQDVESSASRRQILSPSSRAHQEPRRTSRGPGPPLPLEVLAGTGPNLGGGREPEKQPRA